MNRTGHDRAPLVSVGRITVGALLIGLGVAWLIESLGVADVPWHLVLPLALMSTGTGLAVAGSLGERPRGLVWLGVILIVVLSAGTAGDVTFAGGIGDRVLRPAGVADLTRYRLGIGDLTVDLRGISFPAGTTRVEASVGLGELTILVPGGVSVLGRGHAGAGEITFFGKESSGLDVDLGVSGPATATSRLSLDLSVGLGSIEVRR